VRGDLRSPSVLLATGVGVGFAPVAPGTFGSLLGVGLWWFALAELEPLLEVVAVALLAVMGTVVVIHACRARSLGDEPAIVLDEIVGQCIALLLAPRTWWALLAGFVLFRLFDIVKVGPVAWADRRIKGGLGVMLDDVLAGLLSLAVLQFSVLLVGAPWAGGAG